jgi:hypothetical protein
LISEFFSQLTSNAATNAEQITSWPPDFADLKNSLTFILSPLRKGRGELTAVSLHEQKFISAVRWYGMSCRRTQRTLIRCEKT